MQTFIDFLVNNYFWFLIISLILVFALIGYLVDTSEKPSKIKKEEELLPEPIKQEEQMVNIEMSEQVENNIVEPVMNTNNIEANIMETPFPTIELPKENKTEILDDLDNL